MAKSESTKYRLAEAMKTCMKTTSVDDITIRQIVEVCGVTRQTFYRNFLDKYDLINWYFDRILLESFQSILQPSTRSFIRLMDFNNVDLPHPDGPINAVILFASISRFTFFRAWKLP